LKESDESDIRELLMGRRVLKVDVKPDGWGGKLTLDDGREVEVVPNMGCGGCMNGNYYITSLERVDNIITRVDFEEEGIEAYRIFVLAGDERINLLSVEGDDNGYYGTGYELVVTSK